MSTDKQVTSKIPEHRDGEDRPVALRHLSENSNVGRNLGYLYHLREIIVHLLVSKRQEGSPCRNEVTQRSGASEVLGTQ